MQRHCHFDHEGEQPDTKVEIDVGSGVALALWSSLESFLWDRVG